MRAKVLIGYDGIPPRGGRARAWPADQRRSSMRAPLVSNVIAQPRSRRRSQRVRRGRDRVLRAILRQGSRAHRRSRRRKTTAGGQRLTGRRDLRADRLGQADRDRDRVDSPRQGQACAGRHGRRLACSRGAQHVAVAPARLSRSDARLARIGVAVDGGLGGAARTDGRERSRTAVGRAAADPQRDGRAPLRPRRPALAARPEEYREFKEKEWEHIQEEAVGRVPDSVPTEPLLLHGDPAETLAEAASDLDLLVLGSRG